ncbi:MAG TPA: hypothetical protein PKH33_13765, partial [bacterium]|nr:hypothetical protein [bacterium]
ARLGKRIEKEEKRVRVRVKGKLLKKFSLKTLSKHFMSAPKSELRFRLRRVSCEKILGKEFQRNLIHK